MATPAVKLSMKLLIDRKTQRLLFAEAGKNVVDFLFSLLTLPLATSVKLLGQEDMVGCVSNLYAGVEKLSSTYDQPGAAKDALLCPTVLSSGNSLLGLPAGKKQVYLYRCTSSNCSYCIASEYGRECPSCEDEKMTTGTQLLPSVGSGFVQGIVKYIVRDNLTVTTPMAAVSNITLLLNTFAVDIGDLQEKKVQLGYSEGLAILKASLQSKTVLTDVFLHGGNNKKPPAGGRA